MSVGAVRGYFFLPGPGWGRDGNIVSRLVYQASFGEGSAEGARKRGIESRG
jgi:hypothetical protein